MDSRELIERSYRLLENASFIRKHFVPLALQNERWSVVVYETQRVIELLLKSLICLAGEEPENRRTHRIDLLADRVNSILPKLSRRLLLSTSSRDEDGYGILIYGDTAEVYRQDNYCLTHINTLELSKGFLTAENLLRLDFSVTDSEITLTCDEERIITVTDNTYLGSFSNTTSNRQQEFVIQPNPTRLSQLKEIGKALTGNRERAFFEMTIFSEEDALEAIEWMKTANQAASSFFGASWFFVSEN